MALLLQPASREALAEAQARLDTAIDGGSATEVEQTGNDLFAVLRLLLTEKNLRRNLTDPSVAGSARSGLADQLLNGKISRQALDSVSELVASRWSQSSDVVEALETLARQATLAVADKSGQLETVEDELFRFGRILDREPQLNTLLGDASTAADERVGLLKTVLGAKASPVTAQLLEQTVRTPRGRSIDLAAEELSELASARRDRYVAHVRTPVRITAAQEQRLSDALSRLYGRQISLQVELDSDLLGGLVVRVGGELIDGSIAGKLAAARRQLPS